MMDFGPRDILSACNTIGTFAIGIWLYLEKRSDKTNARIDATNAAVETLKTDSILAVDKLREDTSAAQQKLRDDTGASDRQIRQEIESRLDEHGEQLAHLEAKAEEAPTHGDLSAIHEKVNKVAESQGRLEGVVDGIDDNVRTLLNRIIAKGLP